MRFCSMYPPARRRRGCGAVVRLTPSARALLRAHFVGLPLEDRRLRFGASLSAGAVVSYVDAIDFRHDAVFAVLDGETHLAGVAHLALGNDEAELGVSVLPEARGRGVGQALFAAALSHARQHGVARLLMHCLAGNAAMMHIARKFGMDVAIAAGEADAYLAVTPDVTAANGKRARHLHDGAPVSR